MFEHKLKNAYIGQWIYNYSYDFMNKSVATLQSDWWTFSRNWWTVTDWWSFTSNWFHNTNTSESNKFWLITRPVDFSNASKIIITWDLYLVSGSWNGAIYAWALDWDTYPTTWFSCRFNSMNNSGYTWFWLYTYSTSAGVFDRTTLATWNYSFEYNVDFSNMTTTVTLNSYNPVSTTLNSTDVTALSGCTHFWILFDKSNCYIKNTTLEVEY